MRATRDQVQQLLQGVLAVSGGLELDEVRHAIIATALAVTREALSNVARHAKDSKAEVDVVTADGFLVLRVADDGVACRKKPVAAADWATSRSEPRNWMAS